MLRRCTGVTSLDLTNQNLLTSLPSSVGYLVGLQRLYNEGCTALARLPEPFYALTQLVRLNSSEFDPDVRSRVLA